VLVLRHSGGVPRFASDLLLIPELDLGLFVSYHSGNAFDAKAEFVDAFLDRYVPVDEPRPMPDGRPARADAIGGQYRSVSVTQRLTYGKLPLASFNTSPIDVRFEADGTLVTDTDGNTDRWVEIEPFVFRRVDEEETLAFREDDGVIAYLFREESITAFEPVFCTKQWVFRPDSQLSLPSCCSQEFLAGRSGPSSGGTVAVRRSRAGTGEPDGSPVPCLVVLSRSSPLPSSWS
jgi:hypothetical protein